MPSGHFVLTDGYLLINAVNLSAHVKEARLEPTRTPVDDTTWGDTTEKQLPGLLNWRVTGTLMQDFAAAQVDATLWTLFNAGTIFAWTLRADQSDGVGVTNPNYSGNGFLTRYPPIGGRVGEALMAEFEIVPAGASAALTRATA